MVKGQWCICLSGQQLDLSRLKRDIALSTESLKELEAVKVLGSRIVTVENLPRFHDYPGGTDFVSYPGGFHNWVKRAFILYVHQENPHKEYRHFGDIDAGGFYILEHLKKKTGVPFQSLHMGREQCRPLTEKDRKQPRNILKLQEEEKKAGKELPEGYGDVIQVMLEMGCKLEQETVEEGKVTR